MKPRFWFLYLLINSAFAVTKANSPLTSESRIVEVSPTNREDLCLYIRLSEDEYYEIGEDKVFWILINQTINVLYYDNKRTPVVCAPLKLTLHDSINYCWRLTLLQWAYYRKENRNVIVDLGAFRKNYKEYEYLFDESTGTVEIECLQGSFIPCSNRSSVLKLALTGSSLKKFEGTKPNIYLYGNHYGENYFEYSNQNQPRVCFETNSSYVESSSCSRITIEKLSYTLLPNESVILPSGAILPPSQYIFNYDGQILVCADDFLIMDSKYQPDVFEFWFSLIGISISFVCLFLHVLAFIAFRDLRTYSRQLILCLSVSLMFADLFYLLRLPARLYTGSCRLVGVMTLFFHLSSFFWMGVIGFHLNQVFAQSPSVPMRPETQRRRLLMYALFAWGLAFVIMLVNVFVDQLSVNNSFQSYYEFGSCWIAHKGALMLFFALPLAIILLVNVFFFIMIIYNSRKILKYTKCNLLERHKWKFRTYCSLFILLGFGWVVAFIVPLAKIKVINYICIILTAPHGVYIFVVFTCLASPVRRYLREQNISALKENAANADTEKASMTSLDACEKS